MSEETPDKSAKALTPRSQVSMTLIRAVIVSGAIIYSGWLVRGAIDSFETSIATRLQNITGKIDALDRNEFTKQDHDRFVFFANSRGHFPLPYEAEYLDQSRRDTYPGNQPPNDQ